MTVIGTIDYVTGTEIRTFPLYSVPVSLVAWYRGRLGAILAAMACAGAWLASNLFAGLRFSGSDIWLINTVVQGVSFATVGILIAVLRDVVARERALNRIDPLTSLLNSRAFYQDAQGLLSLCRRKGYPITVAYVDLDRFKEINDRLGHRAGDDVLRTVGTVFRQSVRPSDLVARLGGDEFVILLPATNAPEASAMLERVRLTLQTTFESASVPITGSIGAVTFVQAPAEVEPMVHDADACMYSAKKQGGNHVRGTIVVNTTAADQVRYPLAGSAPVAKPGFTHQTGDTPTPRIYDSFSPVRIR